MSKIYQYYNVNPKGERQEDCVTRAISLATGIKYYEVADLLNLNAELHGCEKLCVCCYESILTNLLGYKQFYCDDYVTVEDLAKWYPNDKLIIRIDGHLTCSLFGEIYDIWDCTNEVADCYWVVN